jgi:hypothetical protein
MDRKGFAFKQDKLFAYEKMISDVSKKLVEVVPITFDGRTTFQSLVDEIIPQVVSEPNV